MWKGGAAGMADVIAVARRDGMARLGARTFWPHRAVCEPVPVSESALANATLPDGRPLPASWRAWLRFDGAWLQELGWFESLDPLVLSPRTFAEIVRAELGDMWAPYLDVHRFRHCFLLSGGSESRRILVLTDSPDSEGEHPVLFTDVDDQPTLGALHPGLDAYLGWAAGLLEEPKKLHATYTDLAKAPPFKERNAHHVKRLLGGKWEVELPTSLNAPAAKGPVVGRNPLTGEIVALGGRAKSGRSAPKKKKPT